MVESDILISKKDNEKNSTVNTEKPDGIKIDNKRKIIYGAIILFILYIFFQTYKNDIFTYLNIVPVCPVNTGFNNKQIENIKELEEDSSLEEEIKKFNKMQDDYINELF